MLFDRANKVCQSPSRQNTPDHQGPPQPTRHLTQGLKHPYLTTTSKTCDVMAHQNKVQHDVIKRWGGERVAGGRRKGAVVVRTTTSLLSHDHSRGPEKLSCASCPAPRNHPSLRSNMRARGVTWVGMTDPCYLCRRARSSPRCSPPSCPWKALSTLHAQVDLVREINQTLIIAGNC